MIFPKGVEGAKILTNPTPETLAVCVNAGAVVLKNPKRIELEGVPPHLWEPNIERNEIHAASSFVPTPIVRHIRKMKLSSTKEFWYQVFLAASIALAINYFIGTMR